MEPIALGGRHASAQIGVARDSFRRAKGGIRQSPPPEVKVAGNHSGRLEPTPTLGGSPAAEKGAGNKVPDKALHQGGDEPKHANVVPFVSKVQRKVGENPKNLGGRLTDGKPPTNVVINPQARSTAEEEKEDLC